MGYVKFSFRNLLYVKLQNIYKINWQLILDNAMVINAIDVDSQNVNDA